MTIPSEPLTPSVEEQYTQLVSNLGLSPPEACEVLGLECPPLEHDLDLAKELKKMFPHIPQIHIRNVLEEYEMDVDKATENLLNYDVISANNELNVAKRKQERKQRKTIKKFDAKLQSAEQEIAIIASTLKIDTTQAAELYADNDFSLNNTLALKRKLQPIVLNIDRQHVYSDPTIQSCNPSVNPQDINEFKKWSNSQLLNEVKNLQIRIDEQNEITKERLRDPHKRMIASDSVERTRSLKNRLQLIKLTLKRNERINMASQRIDLHGLTLEEAKVTCDDFLQQLSRNGRTLEIVTGAGNHSVHGHSVIRKWLKSYLAQYGQLKVMETPGSFVVRSDV